LNCNFPSISLTATGGGTYAWSNSIGTSFGTNSTISVTVGDVYTVTVTGSNGCTDTESFIVDYIPNPTLTVSNMTICSGNSVTLTAIATPLLGGTYSWSGGLGSTTNTSVTTPPLGSNAVYQVTYTDPNGCISNTVNVTVTVLQSPSVTVSGTTTMCSGTNGVLTAIPSITGGDFLWSDGTQNLTQTTANITVSPTVTTTYSLVYTAPNGCPSPNVAATISVIPTPVITAPSTGICTGGQTTITATPDLLGGAFTWAPLPAGQVNGPSIQVSPAATTNYVITYLLNGCTSIPVTVQVTVTDVPTVSVDSIGICTGGTGTMVAVPSSTAGVGTYTWTPSWTGTSVVDDETFEVSPPQTSPISVVYTLNNCPSLPVTSFITVTNAPTLSFTGTTLCAGSTGTLTAVPSFLGGTFEWENGEITPSIQITTAVDTTYNVDYNLNGCIVTGTANVTVDEIPNVTFMATVTEGCAPLTVKLINTTASTNNCTWDLGNGATVNQCGNLSYTFMEAGCFDISLTTDSPNGCSNTLTLDDLVCVYPQPVASFNTTTEVISSDNPTLNVTNTSVGAVDFIWNYGNGVTETSLFQPDGITYTGDIEPEYVITLIAISENGCIDTTYRVIKVRDELLIFAPNTFIPDGDGLNDTWFPVITAGMEENTYELIIVNRWGEIMFQTKDVTAGWDGTYKGNECQDGTYTYYIRFRSTFDKQFKNITGHINLLR
jgi:gliding motility-associated-like protein